MSTTLWIKISPGKAWVWVLLYVVSGDFVIYIKLCEPSLGPMNTSDCRLALCNWWLDILAKAQTPMDSDFPLCCQAKFTDSFSTSLMFWMYSWQKYFPVQTANLHYWGASGYLQWDEGYVKEKKGPENQAIDTLGKTWTTIRCRIWSSTKCQIGCWIGCRIKCQIGCWIGCWNVRSGAFGD